MVALEHDLAQQVLEVRTVELAAQLRVHRPVSKRERGSIVIVEPRGERVAGDDHAVGRTVVALPQVELIARDHRFQAIARNALPHQAAALVLHHPAQLTGHILMRPLQHDHLVRLLDRRLGIAQHVPAEPRGENRLLHRRLVGTEQRLEEDIRADHALAVERAATAEHVGQANERVLGRGGHLAASVLAGDGTLPGQGVGTGGYCAVQLSRVGRRRAPRLGIAGAYLVAQVALVQETEHPIRVQVAVEGDVAIRQVVMARMGIKEVLVGELGDMLGVATALARIRRIGEERLVHRVVQHARRVRERALHLVVDHAVHVRGRGIDRRGPTALRRLV